MLIDLQYSFVSGGYCTAWFLIALIHFGGYADWSATLACICWLLYCLIFDIHLYIFVIMLIDLWYSLEPGDYCTVRSLISAYTFWWLCWLVCDTRLYLVVTVLLDLWYPLIQFGGNADWSVIFTCICWLLYCLICNICLCLVPAILLDLSYWLLYVGAMLLGLRQPLVFGGWYALWPVMPACICYWSTELTCICLRLCCLICDTGLHQLVATLPDLRYHYLLVSVDHYPAWFAIPAGGFWSWCC